jgi:hypothetical protein
LAAATACATPTAVATLAPSPALTARKRIGFGKFEVRHGSACWVVEDDHLAAIAAITTAATITATPTTPTVTTAVARPLRCVWLTPLPVTSGAAIATLLPILALSSRAAIPTVPTVPTARVDGELPEHGLAVDEEVGGVPTMLAAFPRSTWIAC